ncbi:hypothetical protein PFISCL1PPCAC_5128, partial [Pristionchus fissidentatus]
LADSCRPLLNHFQCRDNLNDCSTLHFDNLGYLSCGIYRMLVAADGYGAGFRDAKVICEETTSGVHELFSIDDVRGKNQLQRGAALLRCEPKSHNGEKIEGDKKKVSG